MHRIRLLAPLALVAFSASVGLTFFASTPGATAAATTPTTAKASPASSTTAAAAPTTSATDAATTSTTAAATTSTTAAPTTPATVSLASSSLANGEELFDANCASCHGAGAAGSSRAPNLVGLGSATVDFWVSSGRMPLAVPSAEAEPKRSPFTASEQLDIVKYVSSLSPGGPGIPSVNLQGANLGDGFSLFVTNCAGCHAVGGVGDALSNGLSAPSLSYATPTQVAEAIETGPASMPRFSSFQFDAAQINDITAYVTEDIQHPDDRGGNGLGHIGPITEGLVALFLGLGSMLGLLYWIGDRT